MQALSSELGHRDESHVEVTLWLHARLHILVVKTEGHELQESVTE